MDVSPLQRKVKASDLPLESLAGNSKVDKKEKVKELSRQFEAVLLRQILQEAEKPAFKSNLMGGGAVNDIYQDIIVNQMADNISKSSGLGLAASLQTQLTRQLVKDEASIADTDNSSD
jgi:flagellar protein FlgJ